MKPTQPTILTQAIVYDSVTSDARKRKEELDPLVRRRIVQWAKAAQVQDSTGQRLPLALSYIQEWWIEDGFVVIMHSEQSYLNLTRSTFSMTLLDDATFKQYVYDAYAVRREREGRKYHNKLQSIADDLKKAIAEII